jgi:hypothetical protein
VLILDTTTGAITGRIDLTDPDDAPLLPRPDRMLAVGGHVWVSLDRLDATFTPPPGDARIAVLNPTDDTRTFNIDLPNLAECGGMALSPSGKVVALACTGALVDTSSAVQSGVVLLDVTGDTPVVQQVFPVAATLGGSVGPTIAFASETLLVGFVYGDTAKGRNDLAYTLDVTTGAVATLVDAGAAYVLGDVRCTPGCGDTCAMADAQAEGVRFWKLTGEALVAQATVNPDPRVGLPPRYLGAY